MNTPRRTPADEPVADAYLLIAAGVGLVVQNSMMVRITQTSSTILIAMLLNSLVGIVLFVTILWFKQGAAGFGELVASVRWWTLIPGLLGSFFVFASISGYQNVGAATTIAVLVASQLIGGLALDIARSHGVTLRAMVGPAFGALLLVIGAWLIAKRQF
ncbi:TPA_asm: DMT family transporter [Salmonella enterica subsp. houtenae serovar 44:z4,z24:-]|nr:DMT family transporter [Salmonella enterica subsp. houtenae serovar 44:z4,z24:-]